jgi:hypothetical protein
MLHTGGNQAIELSAHNIYKYSKNHNYDDNDETALSEINNQESNLTSSKKKSFNLRRILLISIPIISLGLIVIAIIGAILILEKPANYKKHKVFKLMPTSVDDLNAIITFEKNFQVLFENSFIISFL